MSSIKAKFRILEQEPIKAVFKVNAVIPADEIKEDLQNEISRAKQAENQLQGQINGITADIDDIAEELTTKADKSNTYTKAETNNLLAQKQAIGDYATNSALNQGLATKQPIGNYALKSEIPDVSNFATKTSLNQTNQNLDALTGDVENIAGELDSKADKSEIPTKTSDLENDSNYTTEQEVAQMIASIPQFEVKIVQELPETGQAMVLYLVPKDGEAPDVYLEYIWLTTTQTFELIGSTTVDLTDYVKFTDYATATTAGVIRPRDIYGTTVTGNGYLAGSGRTNEQYKNDITGLIISKATLENIKEDLVTSIGDTKYQPIIEDLDNYVKNTDYPGGSNAGVVKTSGSYALTVSANGYIQSQVKTKEQYEDLNDNSFIGKGTLENIKEDLVTSVGDSKYQDKLTVGNGIDITNNKISTNTQFVITEDMFDIEFDDTKGVAPYNVSYGYTNVTISDDAGVEWVEGASYSFVIDTKQSPSAYRNVRVRIGESGDWKPIMVISSIAVGNNVFIKALNPIFIYKSVYQPNGALHALYDTNTTYTINYSIDSGSKKAGIGTYAVDRYTLIMQKPDLTWEKIVDTSKKYSTATTKTVNKRGFLLNQIRFYNYTAACANGALIGTTVVYEKSASVNASYSFNCGTAPNWEIGDYIYLVGKVKDDGLFYLDETKWWDNKLPTDKDGKLYIQLGIALTTTDSTFSLYSNRPIFYHDGTGIKEYIPTGAVITKTSNNQSGTIMQPDGRMEQWGLATSSNTGETEFTINNSFVDTNFQVFIEPRQAGDLVHYAIPSATNKFKARIQNTSGTYMTCQFQWRAYGFWK